MKNAKWIAAILVIAALISSTSCKKSTDKSIDITNTESKNVALTDTLKQSYTFSSNCAEMFSILPPDEVSTIPQGGIFVGRYYYQCFLKRDFETNEEHNIVKIVKYDTVDKKTVLVSQELSLNHANDIAYNRKLKCLIVVHNNPNRTKISFVDTKTLTVIREENVPMNIFCMDYNEDKGLYVVGLSGGQNFAFLDENFNQVGITEYPTGRTYNCTTQGVTCDDDFIYFVLYNENLISVYDWQGEFVTVIKLDVGDIEPENITVRDDNIYVGCANFGLTVFSVKPIFDTE